jgi:hypothetical protein
LPFEAKRDKIRGLSSGEAMTAREFLRRMDAGDDFEDAPRCVECRKPLSESVTGNRYTGEGYVDSDCYFEKASNILEQYPIRSARLRRG